MQIDSQNEAQIGLEEQELARIVRRKKARDGYDGCHPSTAPATDIEEDEILVNFDEYNSLKKDLETQKRL